MEQNNIELLCFHKLCFLNLRRGGREEHNISLWAIDIQRNRMGKTVVSEMKFHTACGIIENKAVFRWSTFAGERLEGKKEWERALQDAGKKCSVTSRVTGLMMTRSSF